MGKIAAKVAKPVTNLASNVKSKKILVWAAVTAVVLGVPADPNWQVAALGFAGGCYLLGQGVADRK